MRLSALFAVLAAAAIATAPQVPASAEPSVHATPQTTESQSGPPAEPQSPGAAKPDAGESGSEPAAEAQAPSAVDPDADSATAESETGTESDTSGEAAAESEVETVESDSEEATEPEATEPTVVVTIDKGIQEMTVWVDGIEQYTWPVSTGIGGYSTPSGTYTASSMNKIWYSRQWDNAPMPHAVFFTKKGHAIHGTAEEKKLGNPASHGCVRLSRKNAETLFKLVEERGLESTQVVLTGVTPGGEYKVAHPPRQKTYPGYRDRNGWFGQYGYYEQPQFQRRKRKRLFQPYYQGPPQRGYSQRAPRWFRPPGY